MVHGRLLGLTLRYHTQQTLHEHLVTAPGDHAHEQGVIPQNLTSVENIRERGVILEIALTLYSARLPQPAGTWFWAPSLEALKTI